MLLIPNALCWSSRKCNCACALPAEVQLRLRVTRRSWQKLFAGKYFVKILVTAQTQLRSYSEQQRAFGNSNICNSRFFFFKSILRLYSIKVACRNIYLGIIFSFFFPLSKCNLIVYFLSHCLFYFLSSSQDDKNLIIIFRFPKILNTHKKLENSRTYFANNSTWKIKLNERCAWSPKTKNQCVWCCHVRRCELCQHFAKYFHMNL